MPVSIRKVKGGVRVSTPHGVKAKATTPEKAEAQARLLRAVDHGWVPTGRTRAESLIDDAFNSKGESVPFEIKTHLDADKAMQHMQRAQDQEHHAAEFTKALGQHKRKLAAAQGLQKLSFKPHLNVDDAIAHINRLGGEDRAMHGKLPTTTLKKS